MRVILAALLAMMAPVAAMATTVLNSDSILASGDVNLAYGMNVGSRVMVGGNFTGQSATIGTKLDASANGTTVLGVNGNIGGTASSENTTVKYGNIVYGGTNNTQSWGPLSAQSGTISKGTTSASSDFSQAVAISNYLATQASTGTLTTDSNNSGLGIFTGSSSGLNVYNITAAALSQYNTISMTGGTSAIINVTGDINKYLNFSSEFTNSYGANNILFNFVDATSVSFNYSGLPATILATNANVTVTNSVLGSVIGKSISANAPSIGTYSYTGDLAGYSASGSQVAAVPEPASWLALITGFGLVGWAIRRGRSRGLPWLARR